MEKETKNGKKYYYRLETDSDAGKRIGLLYERGDTVMKEASKLAEQLGAEEFFCSKNVVMGGIGGLLFKDRPDEVCYDVVEEVEGMHFCLPNTSTEQGREILKQITSLPVILTRDVCEAFGFDFTSEKYRNHPIPQFFRLEEGWFYVRSSYPLYVEGMTSVTEEEFDQAYNYVKDLL